MSTVIFPFYSVAPNPYIILCTIPGNATQFSVLDLKDMFSPIPVDAHSQDPFAISWTDLNSQNPENWLGLSIPRYSKRALHFWSGTHYGPVLTFLFSFHSFLQYVDDITLYSPFADTKLDTSPVFNFLSSKGYYVSPSKSQLSFLKVTYLGFTLPPQPINTSL